MSLQCTSTVLVIPRRACVARVTVLGCVCVCVCVQLMQLRDKSKHTDSLSIVFCSV